MSVTAKTYQLNDSTVSNKNTNNNDLFKKKNYPPCFEKNSEKSGQKRIKSS